MQKFLDKYVELDGAQDVIWLSPLKVLEAAGSRLQSTSQNTGAIARRSATQKTTDPFAPLWRFTDRKPTEATILGGLDDPLTRCSVPSGAFETAVASFSFSRRGHHRPACRSRCGA